MGSFNASCMVTGIEVDGGEKVLFIPFKQNHASFKENQKLTFEATPQSLLKEKNYVFAPYLLPIKGQYDTYGSLEEIEEDEHTKAIEKHFGISIDSFIEIATCSREFGSSLSALTKAFMKEDIFEKQEHYASLPELLDALGFTTIQTGEVNESKHPKCSFSILWDIKEMETKSSLNKYKAKYKDGSVREFYDNFNHELFSIAIEEDGYFMGVPERKQRIVRKLYGISGAFVHIPIYEALSSHEVNGVTNSNPLEFYRGDKKVQFANEIDKLNTFMQNLNESNRMLQLSKYVSESDSEERLQFHLGLLEVINQEANRI